MWTQAYSKDEVASDSSSSSSSATGASSKNVQHEAWIDTSTTTNTMMMKNITEDSVYDFYVKELFPAIMASLPMLFYRLLGDSMAGLKVLGLKAIYFLLPFLEDFNADEKLQLWEQSVQNSTIADFMIRHFDVNGDGRISSTELLDMNEIVSMLQQHTSRAAVTTAAASPRSFWSWFSREWPLFEWKLGVFLWRSFGGLLLVLAILSIIPGRLHGISGKVLRWPILGTTYLLISIELVVYVFIRLVIRLAELIVATPKHRVLRRKLSNAKCYMEWYKYAMSLDASQGRDEWQRTVNDSTCSRYNWAFIRQLMKDMSKARSKGDSLLALAILQQCTRKNVGGIMSEDLFSFTNTGEPKDIVTEFIDEVSKTIRWITDEAINNSLDSSAGGGATAGNNNISEVQAKAKQSYEKSLERKVRNEKDKLWKSLISWATLSFGDSLEESNGNKRRKHNIENIHAVLSANNKGNGGGCDMDNSSYSASSPGRGEQQKTRARLSTGGSFDSNSNANISIPGGLPSFHREQLIGFLKRARAAYGRTALCLSGGAMMGLYHFGHVVGLMETDCLPNIISGTSAGSVVAAILCTRTNEELKRDLTPEVLGTKLKCFSRPWRERIPSVWKNGHMFETDEWLTLIKWFTCGDMTFEEAYKKTGRTFCITLSSTTKKAPPVLLNYISAPNVTIASAVVASAAVPGFVPPVRLQYKDSDGVVRTKGGEKDETYFDGSIEQDIPVNGLAEMLNCQFFVACQCNPHVVPFFFNAKGGVGAPSRWSSGEQEASWRGGFLLAALELYLKNDMKAKFRFLHDLEAAVGFTSSMMAQEFIGSTTIVPQVRLTDFFKLFTNPSVKDLKWCFGAGKIAAYQHAAMIRLHYSVADALDECLEKLETGASKANLHKRASIVASERTLSMLMEVERERYRRKSATVNPHHLDEKIMRDIASDSTSMSDDSL